MPKVKSDNRNLLDALKTIWTSFIKLIIWLWNILKSILILLEKAVKVFAIFILAISASILFLTAGFYLFTNAFGLKDSPVFQELRDSVAQLYATEVQEEITESDLIEMKLNQ